MNVPSRNYMGQVFREWGRISLCSRSKTSLQPETREILGNRFWSNQEERQIVIDRVGTVPCTPRLPFLSDLTLKTANCCEYCLLRPGKFQHNSSKSIVFLFTSVFSLSQFLVSSFTLLQVLNSRQKEFANKVGLHRWSRQGMLMMAIWQAVVWFLFFLLNTQHKGFV